MVWIPGKPRDSAPGVVFFGGGSTQPAGVTTTTQTSAPWSGQQPYLSQVFGQAQNLYDTYRPQYFPGSTAAAQTPTQQLGLGLETAAGLAGNSSVNAANSYLTSTLGGDYLSAGNPYFQGMANQVLAQTVPGLEAQFAQGNRMTGPGAAYAVGEGADSALGGLAYQNYNDRMQQMSQAAMLAPAMQSAGYQNIAAVTDAGNQQQAQNQAQLNDQVARWNFQQQLPYQTLQQYANLIGGNYGGTSTLSQPYFENGAANSLLGGTAQLLPYAAMALAFA